MNEPWDGNERRSVDTRGLREDIVALTRAVAVKADTIDRVFLQMKIGFAVLFALLMVASIIFVTGLNRHMDEGHGRIICELNLTAEQKTALGDLACK